MILCHTKIGLNRYDSMGYDSTPIPNSLCFCDTEKSIIAAVKNPNITGIITSDSLAKKYDVSHIRLYTHPTPKSYFWQLWQQQDTPTTYTKPNAIAADTVFEGSVHVDKTGITIGNNVKIGAFSVIKSGTTIGNNVTIGANCVLGGEALQTFIDENGHPVLVQHMGELYIENNVKILDSVVINRGVFTYHPTIITPHCIVDNSVTIAHGCHIGTRTQIAAGAQLSGRTLVGNDCFLAPSCTTPNNITIGDNCYIAIGETVRKTIPDTMGQLQEKILPAALLRNIIKL